MPNVEAPWAKVPIDLMRQPGITLGDVQVFVHIDFEAGKRGYWHGTQREIVEATGVSERTVRSAIVKLSELGYIETRRLGIEHGTVLRYWVLSRARPIEEAEMEDERAATDGRSVGEELPVGRRGIAGPTTSLRDLPTDPLSTPLPPILTDEQERIRQRFHRLASDRLMGGANAPAPEWCIELILRGATLSDCEYAIDQCMPKIAGARAKGFAYCESVLERVVSDGGIDAQRTGRGGSRGGATGRGANARSNGRGRLASSRGRGASAAGKYGAYPPGTIGAEDDEAGPGVPDAGGDPEGAGSKPPLSFPGGDRKGRGVR